MRSVLKIVRLRVPKWVAVVYCCLAVCLLPWIFYLSVTLPVHHLSGNWDVSWVGLDGGLALLLLLTGILAYLKSDWVVIASTATGSFLIVDAWFDITSARKGTEFREAVFLAIVVEIPLAIISYVLAHEIVLNNLKLAVNNNIPKKELSVEEVVIL
jgi:hypothetical protein